MGEFEQELRAQIDSARGELATAQQAGDHVATRSVGTGLRDQLQVAADHDIEIADADDVAVGTERDEE